MANQAMQVVPGALPVGTQVGPWRVVEVLGKGGYGTVYGVERVGQGAAGPFAMKVATWPQDPRFEREVELLALTCHPQVPRLHDQGWWIDPSGVAFPYLVMDRIDGVPLYEWAEERALSSRQVLRVLADVAGALDATHRADCVHRDVKGENVLVSAEGRAFLMDFGAGDFKGSRTLTHELLPPGTPYYRSPQALRFEWKHRRKPGAHYKPGPADDVYALGVTAYILVTGTCPLCRVDPDWEADPTSGPPPPPLVPPSALVSVSPELDALILRMLSDAPEERGRAGEIAQALERAADSAGSRADFPIAPRPSNPAFEERKHAGSARRGRVLVALGATTVAGCMLLAVSGWWRAHPSWQWPRAAQEVRHADSEDGGIVGLGDAGPFVANITSAHRAPTMGLGWDMPKKPLPGQQLPPCRQGFEVEIELTEGQKDTRSCWIRGNKSAAACKASGYEYRGGCYAPSYPPPKLPQSERP
jgi:predicted Ser/Thr protein kinase